MFGTSEILIILFLVLLLFGARKIPELGKGLGSGIRSFKEGLSGKTDEEKSEKQVDSEEQDPKLLK